MKKLSISIGITSYNEGQNIARLLDSLLQQEHKHVIISEVLIISSGSTDATNRIVKTFARTHKKITLITQRRRLGKASAVNLLLTRAKKDIVVLCSADIILAQKTLDRLIAPLKDKRVGIVGTHPVPLNSDDSFFGYAAHLIWNLHHLMSLHAPKMGECIAFRKVFKQIPVLSAVDEVNIESLVRGQGYKAVYVPGAIIYNKGAENIHDFIAGRRRIYAGHVATMYEYSYEVSTISSAKVFLLLLKRFELSWRFLFWTPLVIVLEVYSRFLGFLDYKMRRNSHTVWQITASTKNLPRIGKLNASIPNVLRGTVEN
jgi:glycosyltransferase involved in cell wall biosynthesis